jgi:hypothetical protein
MPGPIPALTASMTKEKHASGSSGDLLLPSPPAEKATASTRHGVFTRCWMASAQDPQRQQQQAEK